MHKSDQTKSRNKNQHYVPQYYFRFFSSDGNSIRVLLRKNGKITPPSAISTQSSDDYFYGDAGVEDEITNYDTKYSANHADLISHLNDEKTGNISASLIDVLTENLLFQRIRTLSHRDSKAGVRDFYKDFFKPQVDDLDNFDSGHSEEANRAVQEVMKKFFEAFTDPKSTQHSELMQVKERKAAISDLKLCFLKNETNLPFIFSDSPAVYSNHALKDYQCSKISESNLGLQIFFPLNPLWTAFLYDPEAYQVNHEPIETVIHLTNKNDVHEINKLQLHDSFNSVYFYEEKHTTYLKELWKEVIPHQNRPRKDVVSLPELTLDGAATGRTVFSICDPEPPFHPNLSFLSVKDLSKSHIPYRAAHIVSRLPPGARAENLNSLIDKFSDDEK